MVNVVSRSVTECELVGCELVGCWVRSRNDVSLEVDHLAAFLFFLTFSIFPSHVLPPRQQYLYIRKDNMQMVGKNLDDGQCSGVWVSYCV